VSVHRPDLKLAALARASRLLESAKTKTVKAKKVRGKKGVKAAAAAAKAADDDKDMPDLVSFVLFLYVLCAFRRLTNLVFFVGLILTTFFLEHALAFGILGIKVVCFNYLRY
jgi:hypothetical protein